jgi:hypothetical protein
VVVSLTSLYIIYQLSPSLALIAWWVPCSLSLIVVLIAAPPLRISWEMRKDARP